MNIYNMFASKAISKITDLIIENNEVLKELSKHEETLEFRCSKLIADNPDLLPTELYPHVLHRLLNRRALRNRLIEIKNEQMEIEKKLKEELGDKLIRVTITSDRCYIRVKIGKCFSTIMFKKVKK